MISKLNWPKVRAWGWYATLVRTPWFCIKLLRFAPAGALSKQRHEFRSEIWLFLQGTGRIEDGATSQEVSWDNNRLEIWKIPKKTWHRFRAYSRPVYALELQYGKRVDETDIERKL